MSQPGNTYEGRKLAGLCTWCGKPAADDSQLCAKHLKRTHKRQRQAMAALRKARRKSGRCALCGGKSQRYRCETCATKLTTSRVVSVTDGVTTYAEKQHRISARTAVEADGRRRYRGQLRRGRQTVGDLDEQDLDQLAIQVAKAKAGLAYARRPEAADVPRIQRREAEHAAIGELVMGLRFGFDICIRNGYPVPEAVDTDDDSDDDEGDDE